MNGHRRAEFLQKMHILNTQTIPQWFWKILVLIFTQRRRYIVYFKLKIWMICWLFASYIGSACYLTKNFYILLQIGMSEITKQCNFIYKWWITKSLFSKINLSPSVASPCSEEVNLQLIIYCLLLLPLFCVRYLFCFAVLCVLSSFAIIWLGNRELAALLVLCSECHVDVIILRLFLTVTPVGL